MEKTLFVGLDNVGKTSIIYTLNRQFSLRNGIRPTLGISRNSSTDIKLLGMKITHWDLGGQQKYRRNYLFKEKYIVFSGAALMFYVVDVLDDDRYEESLEYFKGVLNVFKELEQKPAIFVLFHKFDPNLKKKSSIESEVDNLQTKFEESSKEFDVAYYRTTIHEEQSLIKAFSDGILKVSKKSKMINDMLKDYAKATFSSAVLLLDENGFMMGAHHSAKNKNYLEICQTVAPRFTITMEKLENYDITADNIILNIKFNDKQIEDKERTAYVFIRDFKIDEETLVYIVALAKNERTLSLSIKYLPELADKLKNLMESFCIE